MQSILDYKKDPDDDYYRILGCDQLSTVEQIYTEYKARVLDSHPDKHPEDVSAAKRFTQIQRAKEILTDPVQRGKYDKWLRSEICIPFSEWCGLTSSVHMSMHWGSMKTKPMLIDNDESVVSQKNETECKRAVDFREVTGHSSLLSSLTSQVPWQRDPPSPLLQKFRNYQL